MEIAVCQIDRLGITTAGRILDVTNAAFNQQCISLKRTRATQIRDGARCILAQDLPHFVGRLSADRDPLEMSEPRPCGFHCEERIAHRPNSQPSAGRIDHLLQRASRAFGDHESLRTVVVRERLYAAEPRRRVRQNLI